MKIIGLFFPALISLQIFYRRNPDKKNDVIGAMGLYAKYCLIENLIIMILLNYGLGLEGVAEEAFSSFQFFIKYMVIAIVLSVIVPFIHEVITKHFEVSVTIDEDRDEK